MDEEKLKGEFQEAVTKGIAPIKEQLEKTVSKEELKKIEDLTKANLTKAEDLAEATKVEIAKEVKALKEILKTQGKAIGKANKMENMNIEDTLVSVIKEQYEKVVGGENFINGNTNIRIKAFEPLTHVVNDVTIDGVTALGVSENTQNWFAQKINEVATGPTEDISWLQSLNTIDLVANRLSIIEMCGGDVNIECIGECKVKPLSKVVPEFASADACTVPAKWKSSKQHRKMFSALSGLIKMYFEQLLYVEIQNTIFTKLFENAIDFQNIHGGAHQKPDIVKLGNEMITEMQTLGAPPTTMFLSYVDYNLIKNMENDNGSLKYQCCGGGKLDIFNVDLDIVVKNFVTQGEIYLGSLSKAYIGVEDEVEYVQAYTGDDFDRNCITNRLESDVAVLVPNCHASYFMKSNIEVGKGMITV